MKIIKTFFSLFEIPFKNEIFNQGTHKRGYYLTLIDEMGNKGIGELSVFKGLHTFNTEDLNLDNFDLKDTHLKLDQVDFKKPYFGLFERDIDSRLQFCVEGALLNLLKNYNFFSNYFRTESPNIQGLYLIGEQAPPSNETLKVKIARSPIDLEIKELKKLNSKLRLDANLKLSKDLVLKFNNELANIDYFEDPYPFDESWRSLEAPLAIDENVSEHLHKDLSFLKAIILKPNVLGSISECFRLIEKYPKKIVISSSFETKIGMNSLNDICKYKLLDAHQTHGLDTLKFLNDH